MEVNNDLTSNDTSVSSSSRIIFFKESLASLEFLSLNSDKFVKGVRIFERNLEIWYVGDPTNETIGRMG